MKFTQSCSLPVVYCLLLLAATACKPEYTIETVVELANPEAPAAQRQRLADSLAARLGAAFGAATRLEPAGSGFRVLTSHTGQPTAEMGKLVGATGSVKFEIYDLFRATDPEVRQHLEGVAWADYKAELNGGLMGEAVVAGLEKRGRVQELLTVLNQGAAADIRFVSGQNRASSPLNPGDIHHLIYALRIPAGGKAPIDYRMVETTRVQPDGAGQIGVVITMNAEGARTWGEMTTRAAADGNRAVALLLNGEVFSAPAVQSPITGGITMLSGFRSAEQADNLAVQIPLGPLPLRLKVVSQRVVDQ